MLSERGVSDIQHVGDAGEAYEDARDMQGDVRCITYPVHPTLTLASPGRIIG